MLLLITNPPAVTAFPGSACHCVWHLKYNKFMLNQAADISFYFGMLAGLTPLIEDALVRHLPHTCSTRFLFIAKYIFVQYIPVMSMGFNVSDGQSAVHREILYPADRQQTNIFMYIYNVAPATCLWRAQSDALSQSPRLTASREVFPAQTSDSVVKYTRVFEVKC